MSQRSILKPACDEMDSRTVIPGFHLWVPAAKNILIVPCADQIAHPT